MKFMKKVIDDCAEKCPEEDSNRAGRMNYVPYHGVYHSKKPGKICVVFIAAPSMPVPR